MMMMMNSAMRAGLCAIFMIFLLHANAAGQVIDPSVSYICIEAESGLVLTEQNADVPRPPASMVKMMLMLHVAEGLELGKWTLETPVTTSAWAASMGGSQVFLKAGETHTLGEMMNAVSVCSANDAAAAVAEGLWGTADDYLKTINTRARTLGMLDSTFTSTNGLPPTSGREPDRTTARDMSILAQWCVKYPQIVAWTSTAQFVFRPGEAPRENTNKLLGRLPECDGLKTGFTNAAGWCLTATIKRNDIRLIAVIMGHPGRDARFVHIEQILEEGIKGLSRYQYLQRGVEVNTRLALQNAEGGAARVIIGEDIWITIPDKEKTNVQMVYHHPLFLRAPLKAGSVVGEAQVQFQGHCIGKAPLMLCDDIKPAGWRWKLEQSVLRAW